MQPTQLRQLLRLMVAIRAARWPARLAAGGYHDTFLRVDLRAVAGDTRPLVNEVWKLVRPPR